MFALELNRREVGLRAWRAGILAVMTAALLLLSPRQAHAQGAEALPDPMSSRDLDGIMDRLELDEAQRRAAETLHEQYVEEFKRLREGEIEKFVEEGRAFQGSMPSRKQVEDFINNRERLLDRIARLDNQFFDQVSTVLGDSQQLSLTRLRMARSRERHAGEMTQMVGFLVPAARIDLSEIYESLKLTPDERLMMQTSVMDYESKLTRAAKEMSDAVLRMFLDIFDVMEAAGLDEESFQDPEQAQQAFQVIRDAWATVSGKLMEKAMEISDLNRKACTRIGDALLAENREKFIIRYYEQAYPELPSSNLRALFRKALRHQDLTDEQWMNVSVLRDEFRRQEQNLYESMADLQDTLRATRTPFDFGGMGGEKPMDDEIVDKLADLTSRHEKLVERTTDSLNVHLDADLRAKLEAMEDPALADARAAAAEDEGVYVDEEGNVQTYEIAEDADEPVTRGNQPMTVGDFRQIVSAMELDGASEAVAEQLHAAYIARFTEVSDEMQGKLNEAQRAMWSYDEATGTSRGPTRPQVKEMHELRQASAKAMREIDEKFFRDLAVSFGADPERQAQLDRMRNMRLRASYAMGGDMWAWGFGGQHSKVSSLDMVALCMDKRLLDTPSAAVQEILSTYDAEMTQAMQTRYEKGLEAQHLMDLANADFQAAVQDQGDDGNIAAGVRYQEKIEEASQTLSDASQDVVRINRETLAALKAALPAEEAAALEKAYKRWAFPSVYRGAAVIEGALTKARSLQTLSPAQRDRLETVLGEFEQKHEALCDDIVKVLDGTKGMVRPFGTENMREYQRIESLMAQFQFARDELQARTRRRVQDVLTADQLAQIGGPFAPRSQADGGAAQPAPE